jgi:pentatricopeptide repeat protein
MAKLYSGKGDLNNLQKLKNTIEESGVKDTIMLNELARSLVKCGDIQAALHLIRKAQENETKFQLGTWHALMKGYIQENKPNMVLSLYKEIEAQGEMPNEGSYTYLLQAYDMLGMIGEVSI